MQCCLLSFGFCSRVQIALKDFDFLVLNPALHTEAVLQTLSFLGNKPEMDIDYGIFSLTCMGLCSVCGHVRTYEGIRSEVVIHNCWHPVSASEQTSRHVSPVCYTNTLVQAVGELLQEMCAYGASPRAAVGGQGGAGQTNQASAGPRTGPTALPLPRALEAAGLSPSRAPVGSTHSSPAPREQDLALMASTICHKSQGRRTQRTELLFSWQRGS